MSSIKTRIIVAVSLAMTVVFAGLGIYLYHEVQRVSLKEIDVRLEGFVEKLHSEIEEQVDEGDFPEPDHFAHIAGDALPSAVFRLADSSGVIIYGDSLALAAGPLPLEELRANHKVSGEVWLNGTHFRTFSRRLMIERQPRILQGASSLSTVESTLANLSLLLWTTIPIVLLLSAAAIFLIVTRAFRPLAAMIETANRASASTLHERVAAPKGRDEVAVLGASLNRMMDRLETAFRNQEQFIADASHEIRTPLTIMQSELEYACRSPLDGPAEEGVRQALGEVEHLRKLAAALLQLAKLDLAGQAIPRQPVRLHDLVTDCVQRMTRPASLKNISFRVSIEDPAVMRGDEEGLRSALLNIIENGVKYTPRGGTIEVRLAVRNQTAEITVRDDGIGIPAADLPHIFQPFHRSDASRADHGGSGLGLSIAKRIVEQHGGRITASSDGKSGSTFAMELPLSSDA